MVRKKGGKRGILGIFLLFSFVVFWIGLISACDCGPGVNYDYGVSGIAIGPEGTSDWITENPAELISGNSYDIKSSIKNYGEETLEDVQIVFYLDGNYLDSISKDITSTAYPKITLNTSELSCGIHVISLEIFSDVDCDYEDNYAEREVLILCEPQEFCGDGEINQEIEECDLGEGNGILCQAGYESFCSYCSSECTLETIYGEYCGNGVFDPDYEQCDDGNLISGDGCSSECKRESQKGIGIGVDVTTEDFEPEVWMCDSRVIYDDNTEPGRISLGGESLLERMNNYAFEGEQIGWKVLVMDKNGIDKVNEVYVSLDGQIEANCHLDSLLRKDERIDPSCNARILEEELSTIEYENVAGYYTCTLTVETPESMSGESYVTVEAEDLDGLIGESDETEFWFFNPYVSLSIDGDISFDFLRPGTSGYSSPVLVGNDAESGSGVMLDMFISGTDFYDSTSSGAKCPNTNQLSLDTFSYYASKGVYSTNSDGRSDAEGYVPIEYGIGFNDPKPFYERNEIMQVNKQDGYYLANLLSQGSEISLVFRLDLPEPCNGDFDSGQIYFWGEAV